MRQWDLTQAPVDNGDTGYIRDMLNRMTGDGAEWLVKFCRLVCAAADKKEMTGRELLDALWFQNKISTRVRNAVFRGLATGALLRLPAHHMIEHCQKRTFYVRQFGDIGRAELLAALQDAPVMKGEHNAD